MNEALNNEAEDVTQILANAKVVAAFRDNPSELVITFDNGLELLVFSDTQGELNLSIADAAELRKT